MNTAPLEKRVGLLTILFVATFLATSTCFYNIRENNTESKNFSVLDPSHQNVTTNYSDLAPEEKQARVKRKIDTVEPIDKNFTSIKKIEDQRKAHIEAKNFLTENLPLTGAKVDFISPPKSKSVMALKNVKIEGNKLSSSVFSYHVTGKHNDIGRTTGGVKEDILNDGKREDDSVIVYGVASQFNGCEAPAKLTVAPKQIISTYTADATQGPQAQLAFPENQVILIGCAGNLGFNGLSNVLDEETKTQIGHGYLTLESEDMGKKVIEQLKANSHKIEYICVANVPKDADGGKSVHQILVSAPAFGGYDNRILKLEQKEEIQFLCALQGYRAQFAQCIKLAEESGKPVVFKPAAVGLGAFGNDPKIVAKAFYAAAMEFQDDLKENRVSVELQVFITDEKGAKVMANELGLSRKL